MDISVCVSAYNHEKYICKAIDSILAQKTKYSYEIIVNDDKSTDRTSEVVRETYGDRVKLITQKSNLGLTRSMYEMYTNAEGRYIVDLAGDDFFCDDLLFEKAVNYLESHSEYVSVSSWIKCVNKNEELIDQVKPQKLDYCLEDFLSGETLPGAYEIVRNVFREQENIEYLYESSRSIEEVGYHLHLLEHGKHHIIPEISRAYRYVKEEGASNFNSTHTTVEMFEEYYKTYQLMKKLHNCYTYDAMLLKLIYSYWYPIHRAMNFKQIRRYQSIIGFKDYLRFLVIAPVILIKGGRIPAGIRR